MQDLAEMEDMAVWGWEDWREQVRCITRGHLQVSNHLILHLKMTQSKKQKIRSNSLL